jgi:hypothetical protein
MLAVDNNNSIDNTAVNTHSIDLVGLLIFAEFFCRSKKVISIFYFIDGIPMASKLILSLSVPLSEKRRKDKEIIVLPVYELVRCLLWCSITVEWSKNGQFTT